MSILWAKLCKVIDGGTVEKGPMMKGESGRHDDDERLLMDHREIVIQTEHEADVRSDERRRE